MVNRKLRRRYSRVYNSLGRAELQTNPPEQELNIDQLFDPPSEYWLGFYTKAGLLVALERYGFLDSVRALGYEEFDVALIDEPDEQVFRLLSVLPKFKSPLIEILARRSILNLSKELLEQLNLSHLPVLSVEWLLLQNPLKSFEARAPLPGQFLPGLGLGRNVFELLRNVCQRLKLEGLIVVPSYVHNAIFYSNDFHYCDPHYEGVYQALYRDTIAPHQRDTEEMVMKVTWAAKWGLLMHEHDGHTAPFKWFHEPMLSVVSEQTRDFINSPWYRTERDNTAQNHRFFLVHEPLEEQLAERGIYPYNEPVFTAWQAKEEGLAPVE